MSALGLGYVALPEHNSPATSKVCFAHRNGGVEEISVYRRGHHERAKVTAPLAGCREVFHRLPKTAVMDLCRVAFTSVAITAQMLREAEGGLGD